MYNFVKNYFIVNWKGRNLVKFTNRTLRIIKNAEFEAKKTTNIVYPIHLFLSMTQEKTGVCAEVNMYNPYLSEILNERFMALYTTNHEIGMVYEPFTINISTSTLQVLEIANSRMKRFNQIFINEGHLADAIFRSDDLLTRLLFEGLEVENIIGILCNPRDMLVSLKNYSVSIDLIDGINFRKAEQGDQTTLKKFVESEFGKGWLNSIENGFLLEEIPIYIAVDNEQILGFACYDLVRGRKGIFGPMGTSFSNRVQGIGTTLLHLCLKEMKELGHEYAIIGEAGPLEFYEKACGAVVIPKTININ